MEHLVQNITSGVQKQMSNVCDSFNSLNLYLDEHDLQREFDRKFKNLGINKTSLTKKRDSMVSILFGPGITYNDKSKLMNSSMSSTGSSMLSNNSDVDGSLSVSTRRTTDTSDSSEMANLSMARPKSQIDKEGKIFVSAEFSSDEKLLIVFVTQCGHLKDHGHCRKLRLCFRQVKDGKTSAKEIRKIERSSVCEDFRYNYVYSIPFETFNEMKNSGVTVQIKLKYTNICGRTKELCSTQVSVQDVEEDPVWRSDKLLV